MSCHKAIVMINERAHCFHDYIYNIYVIYKKISGETFQTTLMENLTKFSVAKDYRKIPPSAEAGARQVIPNAKINQ